MPVKKVKFGNFDAVELTTLKIKLIAVYSIGPRIAFFGKPDGDNLLLWEPEKYKRNDWNLRGGHRVWLTRPGADENEETYAVDNDPCDLEINDNGFRIIQPVDNANQTQRGFEVKITDEDKLQVDNFVINAGDMLFSAGIWALTCTMVGKHTQYVIPVGDDSSWDCFSMVMFKTWAGHNGNIDDEQISFQDDLLLINPKGNENKRMLQAHKGIIARNDPDDDTCFAKKAEFDPENIHAYPAGCNMAFYIGPDNFMVEMETMAKEKTIKPGNSAHNIEIWTLKPFIKNIKNVKKMFD